MDALCVFLLPSSGAGPIHFNLKTTNNTELNLGQIKSMLHEIEAMNEDDHSNIIRILEDNEINFMENDNGIFVKMNQLPITIIKEIYEYVLTTETNL